LHRSFVRNAILANDPDLEEVTDNDLLDTKRDFPTGPIVTQPDIDVSAEILTIIIIDMVTILFSESAFAVSIYFEPM
jgi:hypothetical protein